MQKFDYGACWESNAEAWTRLTRAGYDVYRDALHTPAFLRMLPDVAGKRGLDVGCGEGNGTRVLAGIGAKMAGVDIAPTMIRHAEEEELRELLGVLYYVADASALPFSDSEFEFVAAFMSLMDVDDLAGALKEIHRVLIPGGFLQFSILHPCFSPPLRKVHRNEDGTVRSVELGGYFAHTEQMETWTFSSLPEEERKTVRPFDTPYRHFPLSEWVNMLITVGFVIEQVAEPKATAEEAAEEPIIADTLEFPLAMIARVRKPQDWADERDRRHDW